MPLTAEFILSLTLGLAPGSFAAATIALGNYIKGKFERAVGVIILLSLTCFPMSLISALVLYLGWRTFSTPQRIGLGGTGVFDLVGCYVWLGVLNYLGFPKPRRLLQMFGVIKSEIQEP